MEMLSEFSYVANWKLTAQVGTVWRQKLWEAKGRLQAVVQ